MKRSLLIAIVIIVASPAIMHAQAFDVRKEPVEQLPELNFETVVSAFADDLGAFVANLIRAGLSPDFTFPGGFPAWGVAERYEASSVLQALEENGISAGAKQSLVLAESIAESDKPVRVLTHGSMEGRFDEVDLERLRVDFIIDAEGRVRFPIVRDSPDAALAEHILLIADWPRFPVPTLKSGQHGLRMRAPVEFVPSFYEIGELDHPPRPLHREFPWFARNAEITGEITVEFAIRVDGTVDPESIRIVSSPHDSFNEPTIEALRQWTFEPGQAKGQPVRTRVRLRIPFHIVP